MTNATTYRWTISNRRGLIILSGECSSYAGAVAWAWEKFDASQRFQCADDRATAWIVEEVR